MTKSYPFVVRFTTKEQKNAAKRLAKKNHRSLSSYILLLVDQDREIEKAITNSPAKELQK